MGYPIYHSQYTAAQIEASLGKSPRINPDTHVWEVWDITTSAWVSTGIVAEAEIYAVAATVSAMTDHTKAYVYVGTEIGYVKGGWYYWNGSAWTLGGTAVDPTLTVEGEAADAKATGDAIGDLKSAFDKYDGLNIYRPTWIPNTKVNASGNTAYDSSFSMSAPVPVSEGDVVSFLGVGYLTSIAMISTCDSDGSNISVKVVSSGTVLKTYEYAVKSDEHYVCFCTVKTRAKDIIILSYLSNRQLSERLTNDETFMQDIDIQLNAISEYVQPTNLYNKNNELNKSDKMIDGNWNVISISGSSVSHPIKVKPSTTYVYTIQKDYYGNEPVKRVAYCDANGNLDGHGQIAEIITDTIDGISVTYGRVTILSNPPQDYVCINVRSEAKATTIFAEASVLPDYSPYFDPYYQVKEEALPDDLPLPANVENNLLYGKKAAFTGDSICYGAGYTGGYPAIIGSRNNMTVSNIAVSGGTLCSGTGRFCISASIDDMPENYDFYIVEGGVNDASQEHGETLGSLSSGYNATLDTTTLYGAMESLCKKLQLNFKGKKYGFIFPHNVYGETAVWNTGWRDAMKICLKKWGIPFLDLSDECAQLRNLDALRVYTNNNDGWHPTEQGYELYYVPKITAWMKTL